jgi:hypothetical protein
MEQSNDIVDKENVAADFDADYERAQHWNNFFVSELNF